MPRRQRRGCSRFFGSRPRVTVPPWNETFRPETTGDGSSRGASSRTLPRPFGLPRRAMLGGHPVCWSCQQCPGQARRLCNARLEAPSPRLGPGQHDAHGHHRQQYEARRHQGYHVFLAFLLDRGSYEMVERADLDRHSRRRDAARRRLPGRDRRGAHSPPPAAGRPVGTVGSTRAEEGDPGERAPPCRVAHRDRGPRRSLASSTPTGAGTWAGR